MELLQEHNTQARLSSRIGLNPHQQMPIVKPAVAFNILPVEAKVISALVRMGHPWSVQTVLMQLSVPAVTMVLS